MSKPIATVFLVGAIVYGLLLKVPDGLMLNRWALQTVRGDELDEGELVNLNNAEQAVSERAQALLAISEWKRGKHENAIETFEKLSTNHIATRRALWQFQLGAMLRQSNELEAATQVWQDGGLTNIMIASCEFALRSRSREYAHFWCPSLPYLEENPDALCAYGLYNQQLGALESSLKNFRDAEEESNSLTANCLYDYARILGRLGHHEESLIRYEAAYRAKSDPIYLRGAGRAFMQLEEYDKALEVLLHAYRTSRSERDRSESARLLGTAYYRLEDYQSAHTWLHESTSSFDGADASAYLYLARTLRALGNAEGAVEAYHEAVIRVGSSKELIWYRYEFAAYLLEIGNEREAIEVYRDVLEIIPGDETALEALRAIEVQGKP